VEDDPVVVLVARQDHAIPPATERFMAARAHATTVEVDSAHVAMISQPEAATRLILRRGGLDSLIPRSFLVPHGDAGTGTTR